MQAVKYWRSNKLRYRLLGMKRPKNQDMNQDMAVPRPTKKSTPNREDRLQRAPAAVGQ